MAYCMPGMILVVSCIKGLQVIRVISDKQGDVATMVHQILFMFRLKVTAPICFEGKRLRASVQNIYGLGVGNPRIKIKLFSQGHCDGLYCYDSQQYVDKTLTC